MKGRLRKGKFRVIPLLALAVASAGPVYAFLGSWMVELPLDGRFFRLLPDSDAVVVAEIRGVPRTTISSEAPAVIEARVMAAVKGDLPPGELIAFLESKWCGPTYREGEQRLLFLKRGDPFDPTAPGSSLWSLCPVTGKLDCLVDRRDAGEVTPASVAAYLDALGEVRSRPPRLQVVLRKDGADLLAEVSLVNDAPEPVWFDPARVRPLAMVGSRRTEGRLVADLREGAGWMMIPGRGKIAGAIRFPQAGGVESFGVVITLANDAVLYPRRCWTGTIASPSLHRSP